MRNYFSSSEDQAWFDLGVNIVKGGADLFSISQKDLKNHIGPFSRSYYFSLSGKCQRTTPFMELINMTDWGIDMSVNFENFLNEDIRIWAKMMQRAGIDLCDYGTKENQIWESLGIKDHAVFERRESSNIDPTAKIEQLVFGPTPADWSLLYRGYGLIHVFKRQFTPGTYPRELDLPATIIWRPTEEEEGEGPWRTQPRIEIASSQRVLRYHRAQEEKHPFTQLIENTQDDTSTIMLMQYWISRPKSSKSRSHSQPPSVQRRQTIIGKWSLSRNWLGHVHFCPFDSHWRPRCARIEKEQGSTIEGIDLPDLRSCVKGISTERLFSLQESEEWKSRSYLADIAVCQDKHEFHPYYYMSTKQLRHTRDRSCPWGCGKVDLNRLQVPEPLREFHPTRKYEEK
jgi:hypothetical protein